MKSILIFITNWTYFILLSSSLTSSLKDFFVFSDAQVFLAASISEYLLWKDYFFRVKLNIELVANTLANDPYIFWLSLH